MTMEQRVTDIETWINNNKDSVAIIHGLVTSFNGRLGALARRIAQVETITDATLTSNVRELVDRVKMDEAKATAESGRIDKFATERIQMVSQVETIVTQMKDNMSETNKAIKAAISTFSSIISPAVIEVIVVCSTSTAYPGVLGFSTWNTIFEIFPSPITSRATIRTAAIILFNSKESIL